MSDEVSLKIFFFLMASLSALLTYLYFRQGATNENKAKMKELQAIYENRYDFGFSWFRPQVRLPPGTSVEEKEALVIAKAYLIENGEFRKGAFLGYIQFVDSSGKSIFTVRCIGDALKTDLIAYKVERKSYFERPRIRITAQENVSEI